MMKKKFQPLFDPVAISDKVILSNRIGMCPMQISVSHEDGTPSAQDINYFATRSKFGQLLITGATTIMPHIKTLPAQLSIENDASILAFSQLAAVMKKDGGKAILQVQHGGREAAFGYTEIGKVFAPSALEFPFLDYVPEELSHQEISDIIQNFGFATKRAIAAGFDGVEIHGANHYLLQQFVSTYSNHREDYWGGTLDKRLNFALEVTKEVVAVAKSVAPNFIIGYRISPEEVHGETVGYTIDDSLVLIDRLVGLGVDYIHTSTFGGNSSGGEAYKLPGLAGNTSQPMNTLIKDTLAGRVPLVVSGSIKTAEECLDALNYGDVAAMGVAALLNPDFAEKVMEGKEDDITMSAAGKEQDLFLPPELLAMFTGQGRGMLTPEEFNEKYTDE